MSSKETQQLVKDVRELTFQMEFTRKTLDRQSKDIVNLDRNLGSVITSVGQVPAAPVSNLIYNGELGHSVNTWFDAALTTGDKAKEAAHWFSHDGTLTGLTLDQTDARTSSTNKTLKELTHSTYSPNYGRFDSSNGWASITGTKTVDALLPANLADATTPLCRVSMIAARRNPYIEIPNDSLMFAGIYDNTAGQLKFLTGSLGFSAGVVGAVGATERRFRIHVVSDRGYSIVSPEVVILNAPSNAQFSATRNISFNWKATAGQLRVDIYEYIPSSGVYSLIAEVSSGYAFIYQGGALRTVAGYPVSATSERTAVYYTREGEANLLAVNGVSPQWDTVNFPIQIPDNYDKSATTGRQWLRIGFTVAANLLIDNFVSTGTATVTAPLNAFDAEYASEYVGLAAKIYNSGGVLIQTSSVVSRTDNRNIVLADAVPASTTNYLRIVGGGFHGVYIDKVHLGYQQNTSYAPNAADIRVLQPLAAPTSSAQGGVGTGGHSGGIDCVKYTTPVKMADSSWKIVDDCSAGEQWASAEFHPNLLLKLRPAFGFTRKVLSENGVFVECTDTERFVCDRTDAGGTPLHKLRIGDHVLTEIDGRIAASKIVSISANSLVKEKVYTPTLSRNRFFIAGTLQVKWHQQILEFFRLRRKVKGAFVLHNNKRAWDDGTLLME